MRKLTPSIMVAVLLTVLLTSGLLVGCAGDVVEGSGNLDTQEMDLSGFTRVEVGHAFEVEIVQSASYSVSITADDNLFEYIKVSKKGETLKIGLKSGDYHNVTLEAEITMPDLYEVDLSGAVRGTARGFTSSHDFSGELSGASSLDMRDMSAGDIDFDISGASRVTGDIIAGDADLDVSGASTVQLQGSASDMEIEASGASHVDLADFVVSNADVNLSGASQATVNLDGRLDADLSGASNLSYIGEPTMGDIHTSGGSTISPE
jgi:hypothetical protein